MTISLQDYAAGDTNYVSKLNSNNDVLEAAISALQAAAGSAGTTLSLIEAYGALFGQTVAVIGADSYLPSDAGSGELEVAAGYAYRPSLLAVVSQLAATTIDFTGQPAATYYIQVDSTGAPSRSDEVSEALYSVVWSGAAFGAIARLATIVWGAQDWIAAQDSTALGETYESLDDRLEAIEALVATPAVQPYDIGGSYAGVPTASLVLVRYPFPRAVAFPSGLTSSRGVAGVAATAITDFDIQKNGVSVGTMRFAAAATIATFIMASATSFAAGDILTVVAPGTPDATLANLGFALAGTR
jgi:hypothetical protein